MSSSMLVAVRAAMLAGAAEHIHDDPATGRLTSHEGRPSMSETNGKPGAEANSGISQAEHDAAVTAARADGAKAAHDRYAAIFGAEGIKGDGKRMAAAFDLANRSPDMAAADVTAFVTGNVAAADASAPDPAANYEATRLAAAAGVPSASGLSQPDRKQKASASIDRAAIFAARRNQNRGA